ncbi:hypothetical protein [Halalkalibacter oceani]|uniref:hypothetical protein n=1 Tax=Halalkalibacter oceani TaxID=1653776 RepID=UPI003399208D
MMMITLTVILFAGVGTGTVGWASSDLPFGNGSEDTVPMDHMDPTPFVPVAEIDMEGKNDTEEHQKSLKGVPISHSEAPVEAAAGVNAHEDTVPMDHMDPTPFVPVAEIDMEGENAIEEHQKSLKGVTLSHSEAPVDVASDEPIEVVKEVEVK